MLMKQDGILNPGIKPVTWEWKQEKISDDKYNLVYTAAIDEGWTVYSQFTSDDGPVPTEIYYEKAEGITLDGKSIENQVIKKKDQILYLTTSM